MFHMPIGVGAGADRLGLQSLRRVPGRHLTGDHTVEIFLQKYLVHRHNPLLGAQKLHGAPVGGNPLAPAAVFQNHLPREHAGNYLHPVRLKVGRPGLQGDLLPGPMILPLQTALGTVDHRKIHIAGKYRLLMENAVIVGGFHQHPDIFHGLLLHHQNPADLPLLKAEIRVAVPEKQILNRAHLQAVIQTISLVIRRQRQPAVSLHLNGGAVRA